MLLLNLLFLNIIKASHETYGDYQYDQLYIHKTNKSNNDSSPNKQKQNKDLYIKNS